ncbi:hypothetical protein BMW22_15645 [Rhizobium leguminosarum]|uniref:LamG domain-containing protein n=1 Tax=Rhizobium leguminosarum TaxID=384 RepID=A0A1L3ZB59_RHILE|nr:hypothetical protein [Rhizobium leguminosarum]API52858.1 hypothetical protein BMW22_15645 [Rhizobium leguminosarum]
MTVTHFPGGVTNVAEYETLGSFIAPDPSQAHVYFNDFDIYTATDWTVTETQAGATQAITAGDGGLLALTNSAANADINAIALANLTFNLTGANAFWLKARLKVDDITNSDILFGLMDTMTAFNPANGVYIFKAAGAATMRLSLEKASATTNTAFAAPGANDTFATIGISYNPDAGVVTAYLNDVAVLRQTDLTNMPVVNLTPAIGVRNGTAAARTLTVDYIFAAKQR